MATAYVYALGRRKSATARVRLMTGKGAVMINDCAAHDYFMASTSLLRTIGEPFGAVDLDPAKFDLSIHVSGGGHSGQAVAIRLAIAKALAIRDEQLKPTLRRADLLSRDSREKERKKFGLKGARKQRQFTKR